MTDPVEDSALASEGVDRKAQEIQGDTPAAAEGATGADLLEASPASDSSNAIKEEISVTSDGGDTKEEILVTPDGGVTKIILREGVGDLPPLHARCLVHYVGRVASTGEVIMDSRNETENAEPRCIVAGRDAVRQELGLTLAVATMRQGEKCQLKIQPKYGYGEKGSFSFPSVPPAADLVYEIELMGFEPPSEEKERAEMTYEERLEAAERRRLAGNELFNAGNYVDALGKYSMGISYMNEDFMLQLEGHYLEKAEDISAPLRLNMAAAQIKMGDFQSAIFNCNQAVGVEKLKAKALFRRGQARAGAGQTAEAIEDMEAAAKAKPGDKAVARELRALKAQLKEERAATDKLFRGRFKPPVAKPATLTLWQRVLQAVRSFLDSILRSLGLQQPLAS